MFSPAPRPRAPRVSERAGGEGSGQTAGVRPSTLCAPRVAAGAQRGAGVGSRERSISSCSWSEEPDCPFPVRP